MSDPDYTEHERAIVELQQQHEHTTVALIDRIARLEGQVIDINQAFSLAVEALEEIYTSMRGVSDHATMGSRMIRMGNMDAPMGLLVKKVLKRDLK